MWNNHLPPFLAVDFFVPDFLVADFFALAFFSLAFLVADLTLGVDAGTGAGAT